MTKTYAKEATAKAQATKMTNQTGKTHVPVETENGWEVRAQARKRVPDFVTLTGMKVARVTPKCIGFDVDGRTRWFDKLTIQNLKGEPKVGDTMRITVPYRAAYRNGLMELMAA